jgi:hypothetical protein
MGFYYNHYLKNGLIKIEYIFRVNAKKYTMNLGKKKTGA